MPVVRAYDTADFLRQAAMELEKIDWEYREILSIDEDEFAIVDR